MENYRLLTAKPEIHPKNTSKAKEGYLQSKNVREGTLQSQHITLLSFVLND